MINGGGKIFFHLFPTYDAELANLPAVFHEHASKAESIGKVPKSRKVSFQISSALSAVEFVAPLTPWPALALLHGHAIP
jgi:hypothetical protein